MAPPVIIIFGAAVGPGGVPSGAMVDRVVAAHRLGRTLAGAVYMPTGGVGRHGPAEAEVMADMLRRRGVPDDHIRVEATGRNTIGSVLACRALLQGHDGAVYAATSAYHLPRCLILLRMARLCALPCPPPRRKAARGRRRRWWWRLREVPAVPADVALMLWLRLRGRV